MLVAVRRKRLKAPQRQKILNALKALPIDIEETTEHVWGAALQVAESYGLTLYDAAYLELAMRHSLPIATLDRAMMSAAKEAGIELL